mmetsp:Transcript_22045/g.60385  ORF Transcript_22045/g.60385 Transcript_22045/m.60385 type:complete len:133 (+) Transcript_22045:341-739(+)
MAGTLAPVATTSQMDMDDSLEITIGPATAVVQGSSGSMAVSLQASQAHAEGFVSRSPTTRSALAAAVAVFLIVPLRLSSSAVGRSGLLRDGPRRHRRHQWRHKSPPCTCRPAGCAYSRAAGLASGSLCRGIA